MKIYSEFMNETENKTIEYLLSFSFPYPDIFAEQIRLAAFQRDYSPYFRLLYVDVPPQAPLLPEACNGTPIEIQNFRPDGTIACFLVHVSGGRIREIEIYHADHSALDLSSLWTGTAWEGLASGKTKMSEKR